MNVNKNLRLDSIYLNDIICFDKKFKYLHILYILPFFLSYLLIKFISFLGNFILFIRIMANSSLIVKEKTKMTFFERQTSFDDDVSIISILRIVSKQ